MGSQFFHPKANRNPNQIEIEFTIVCSNLKPVKPGKDSNGTFLCGSGVVEMSITVYLFVVILLQ